MSKTLHNLIWGENFRQKEGKYFQKYRMLIKYYKKYLVNTQLQLKITFHLLEFLHIKSENIKQQQKNYDKTTYVRSTKFTHKKITQPLVVMVETFRRSVYNQPRDTTGTICGKAKEVAW